MKLSYSNPWFYQGLPFDSNQIEDNVGFVYLITNVHNNMKYIGKKTFFNVRKVKVKNKVNKKTKRTESDWKDYYGSSPLLQQDVEKLGHNSFKREILYLCKTKSLASYLEAREQILSECLLKPDYYNTWIAVKVHRPGLNKVMPSYILEG